MATPLINIPKSPFVDKNTGNISLEWLLWLQSPQFVSILVSSAIPVASGGTGQTSELNDGQLLIGSTGLNYLTPATITPVANQTTVVNGAGSITIGTAQDISSTSAPTFSGLTINGDASVSNLDVSSDLSVSGISEQNLLLVAGATDDAVNKVIINGGLAVSATILLTTHTSFSDGAGVSLGTLTNAPTAGNPTKWVPFNDNGVTRYFPAW